MFAHDAQGQRFLQATFGGSVVEAGEFLAQLLGVAGVGGALLLGVKGCVTICHGRSRAPAFANAIRFACRAMDAKVNDHIVQAARACELPQAEPNA